MMRSWYSVGWSGMIEKWAYHSGKWKHAEKWVNSVSTFLLLGHNS